MINRNNNGKIRYRMYKKGKHWVFASITASTLAVGIMSLGGHNASAEETITEATSNGSAEPTETVTSAQAATQQATQPSAQTTGASEQAQVTQQPAQTQSAAQQTTKTQAPAQTATQQPAAQTQAPAQTATQQPAAQKQAPAQATTQQPAAQKQTATQQTTQPVKTAATEQAPAKATPAPVATKTTETTAEKVATAKTYAQANTTAQTTETTSTSTATPQVTSTKTTKQTATPEKAVAATTEATQTKAVTAPADTASKDETTAVKSTKVAAKTAASNITTVTKDNFLDYFNVNGTTASYHKESGTVTITENEKDVSGNFALKEKIDLNQNFTLTGKINLGDKKMNAGGDGIGFAFHNGDVTDVGAIGGALGIGNLIDAFGFKFDTYYNAQDYNGNGSKNEYFEKDPWQMKNESYGAFVYTKPKEVPSGNVTLPANPSTAGQMKHYAFTDGTTAQEISHPSNDEFKEVVFDYNGETKTMTVTYENKTWTKEISGWKNDDVDGYAFIVSASTGDAKNLQQFQIDTFKYTAYGQFTALFVEKDTNEQLNSYSKDGRQGTEVNVSQDLNAMFTDLYNQGYDYQQSIVKADEGEYTEQQLNEKTGTADRLIKFDNSPSNATYYFDRAPSQYQIKYVDQNGNVLGEEEPNTSVKAGTDYAFDNTTTKTFDGYRFDKVADTSNPLTGKYQRIQENGDGTVTIIYQFQAQSTVDFLFVDEDDKQIANGSSQTDDEQKTEAVEQNIDAVIQDLYDKGYDVKDVEVSQKDMYDKENKTITYLEDDGSVKYIFNKADGKLIVQYQDTDGNTLEPSETKEGKVGEDYHTNSKEIDGFTLLTTQGNPSGTFTRDDQQVIYIYEKKKQPEMTLGDLVVKYVDENDNEIAPPVQKSGEVGEQFPTTSKEIDGYTLIDTKGDPNGSFTKESQTITYVYKQKEPEATTGVVIVNYVDENNHQLAASETKSGKIGDKFPDTSKEIDGYTLVDTKGNPDGSFAKESQVITYVYKQKDTEPQPQPEVIGNLTVKYVDIATNEAIAENFTATGKEGQTFPDSNKAITGYTFVRVEGNPSGTFTKEAQTITYYYEKNGPVITPPVDPPVATTGELVVNYVDESRNPIATSDKKSGKIGEQFPATGKDIAGYTLVKTEGNPEGQFAKEDQTITYVYKKNPEATSTVTVEYKDKDGNTVSETVVETGNVGDQFPPTSKDVPGYTLVDTIGDPNGSFTKEDQTITYVYEKVDTPTTPENPETPTDTETEPPTTDTEEIPPKNSGNDDEENTPDEPKTETDTNTPNNDGNTGTTVNPPNNDGHAEPNKPSNNGSTTVVTPPHNTGTVSTVSSPNYTASTPATNMNYTANASATAQPTVETASTPTITNPAQSSMLPQTGDAGTQTSLMGGMLLALGALAGTLGFRNRKKK